MKKRWGWVMMTWLGLAAWGSVMAEDAKVEFVTGVHNAGGRYRFFRVDLKDDSNYLLLDTADGRLWQAKFGAFGTMKKAQKNAKDYKKLPINLNPLVEGEDNKPGRFTLFPTQNPEMVLLLDQEEGRSWAMKMAPHDKEERFLMAMEEPVPQTAKKAKTEESQE